MEYRSSRKRRVVRVAAKDAGISAEKAELLRRIPGVDELLSRPQVAQLSQRMDREQLVALLRGVLSEVRGRITGAQVVTVESFEISRLEELIAAEAERILHP